MKPLLPVALAFGYLAYALPSLADCTVNNASLHVTLDDQGKLTGLTSAPGGANLLDAARPSFLLRLQPHGAGKSLLNPTSLRSEPIAPGRTRLTFSFPGGYTATVEVTDKKKYLRCELVASEPLAEIAKVTWGPVNTTMKGPFAEYLGLIREGGSTLGMLSLEPNTDGVGLEGGKGAHFGVASYNGADGSRLLAESWDHTRDGALLPDGYSAKAFPGITVRGSAIALFGCAAKEELDTVEAVELGEKLPHPTVNGVWNKRSNHCITPQTWVHYSPKTLDQWLELAKSFGCNSICNWADQFGNWGHFTPNPGVYPKGIADLRDTARRSEAAGMRHVLYTLSTFLKSRTLPEPFITPEFNAGFEALGPAGVLMDALDADAKRVVLKHDPALLKALEKVKFITIAGELMGVEKLEPAEDRIVLQVARGGMGTKKGAHAAGAAVLCRPLAYENSFCPGTLALQDEAADHIAKVARDCDLHQVTIDGYESCLHTGHGAYAKNRFSGRIFEKVGNPELVLTPSNFGNYDWHMMSHVSWGEGDSKKGFRGTMIDYRIRRALQLRNNLMPRKLGQYYPADAKSPEDFHWLMALATGWDAGVDFYFDKNKLQPTDPTLRTYGEIVRLWLDARRAGYFTDAQKLALRQTDRLYQLTRGSNGKFDLKFTGRWTHLGLKFLPPSVFKIEAQGTAKLEPCGIDWSWTHNPGIYVAAGVSDDLVATADGKENAWNVTFPRKDRLQFVIRVPADAPCAVRNPSVVLNNGTRLVIPVTLEPGQYVSTTHDTALASIYDRNHNVIGETTIRCVSFRLPAVSADKPQRIAVSAESKDAKAAPVIRVNLRTHELLPEEYNL